MKEKVSKIYPELIDSVKLDQWLKLKRNVLFVGRHGVGKTQAMIASFIKAGYNYLYLSGATCDPYVDFVGIPRIVMEGGVQKLKLITREDLSQADVIFIDEYNRAPKKVRNACMELIQFKSINGKPFPNLKCVWAAINPEDESDTYDVEALDPAQEDRFHIKYEIPYRPCENYFCSHFGEHVGLSAIKWWHDLPNEIQNEVSPRRLDYALMHWLDKCDIRDVLPEKSNAAKLVKLISSSSIEDQVEDIYRECINTGNNNKIKTAMNDDNFLSDALKVISNRDDYMTVFVPQIPGDVLSNILNENDLILNHVVSNLGNNERYPSVIVSLVNNSVDSSLIAKIRNGYINSGYTSDRLRGVLFGKINANASIYTKIPDNVAYTWSEHLNSIKVMSNNFQWASQYDKGKSWTKFINYIPEPKDMELEDCIASLELMSGICNMVKKSSNFFLKYENALLVFNAVVQSLYAKHGYSTDTIVKTYPLIAQEHAALQYASNDLYKMSILSVEKSK